VIARSWRGVSPLSRDTPPEARCSRLACRRGPLCHSADRDHISPWRIPPYRRRYPAPHRRPALDCERFSRRSVREWCTSTQQFAIANSAFAIDFPMKPRHIRSGASTRRIHCPNILSISPVFPLSPCDCSPSLSLCRMFATAPTRGHDLQRSIPAASWSHPEISGHPRPLQPSFPTYPIF